MEDLPDFLPGLLLELPLSSSSELRIVVAIRFGNAGSTVLDLEHEVEVMGFLERTDIFSGYGSIVVFLVIIVRRLTDLTSFLILLDDNVIISQDLIWRVS
ncbi:hypothetical protein LOAG_02846 [Loa loa]|uniref:Uncharacterized protein n=1 Tax=Loa loa TaxID=7209 RepID=A0A1S0U7K4_LOALO|nr:hypothetical protein LOAG_02846 [Loa loa]EFO25639.1 hypothetical protein LOAG_02846 [Loa loa]